MTIVANGKKCQFDKGQRGKGCDGERTKKRKKLLLNDKLFCIPRFFNSKLCNSHVNGDMRSQRKYTEAPYTLFTPSDSVSIGDGSQF